MREELITAGEVAGLLGKRKKDSDKRDYGSVVLFAGKEGMAGAAILASKAALRTGAGLVHIATPKENFPILQVAVPEAICIERGDALERLNSFDAVGFGPGVGKSDEMKELMAEVLKTSSKPLIIDADGLNLLAENKDLVESLWFRDGGSAVLTPHEREAMRLEMSMSGVMDYLEIDRPTMVKKLAWKYEAVVALKGSGTLITEAGLETIFRNPTGNPGMATAGAGDVLTGIILALLGQGIDPINSAKAGAYIHGMAGDLAEEKYGERSLVAGDIIESLPEAFKILSKSEKVFV